MASLPEAIAFFDGQNLYHSSNSAFSNASDDYNPKALAALIARRQGWRLLQTQFYKVILDQNRDRIGTKMRHGRLLRMNREGEKRQRTSYVIMSLAVAAKKKSIYALRWI